jgi:hydroxymethylpyrimidine/phosphomethylpyrimidine kinase
MARRDARAVSDRTRIALTIAGSDSGGGAGIQADFKTFAAFGVHGASVVTALTAQNTRRVGAIHYPPPAIVAAQIEAVLEDFAVAAIKIGMLGSAQIVAVVAEALRAPSSLALRFPASRRRDYHRLFVPFIVYDPVMIASSGEALSEAGFVEAIRRELLPIVDCLTPNLAEAAALLGEPLARTEADMTRQGEALLKLGPRAALMKGGHLDGDEAVDLMVTRKGVRRYAAPRLASRNLHGTGCTLSSAIAANVVLGMALPEAVAAAKAFVSEAIERGRRIKLGAGDGPVIQVKLR